MTTNTIINRAPETRACDTCGQVTSYDPIMVGEIDLSANLPHFCFQCAETLRAAEVAAAEERQRERRQATWDEIIPKKFRDTNTRHDGFNRKLWDAVRLFPLHKSMGLIGPSGRCKTRVLALTARRVIVNDQFVGWCPATSFQWAAQSQFDKEDGPAARKWLRRWQDCGVLFLDDLGKHRWTEAVESAFFALIDLRSSRGQVTHWSMNPLPADERDLVRLLQDDAASVLARALDPSGEAAARPRFAPILSRLLDDSELIPVP